MEKVKDQPREKKRQGIFLKSGAELTPELEEELAAEAERGYDLSKARRHYLDQPLISNDKSPRITLTISPAQLDALCKRAEDEGRTITELAQDALERYLDS
jgi:hypothetical protein